VTVANLGVVMAQAGLKTVVIDADFRRPVQHQIFQLPSLGGLTDLLRSPEDKPQSYMRSTRIENLTVITSGAIPPNPSELLGSQRMEQVMAELADLVDMIICDSPPVLIVADAAVLSNRVDGVVLVTRAGKTRLGAIQQAIFNLNQAGAHLLGGVLNQVRSKQGNYYSGYNYYYSPNGRSEANDQPTPVKAARRVRLPFSK
jgi:capsular exopolysaccharide synthesis family protein